MADQKQKSDNAYQVSRNYIVTIKDAKGKTSQLSPYIDAIRIVNSVDSVLPVIYLTFNIENSEIIRDDIFGEDDIILHISVLSEDKSNDNMKVLKFNLIYLESDLALIQKTPIVMGNMKGEGQTFPDRQPITIKTILKEPYVLLSKGVNYIAEKSTGKSAIKILQAVASKIGVSSKTRISTRGENTSPIGQVLIPPMSLNKSVDFLNEKYGLYKGPLLKYCTWDAEKSKEWFTVEDMSEKMKLNPDLIIHHLPIGYEKKAMDKILESVKKENEFYTINPIITKHFPNTNVLTHRYKKIQIIHPDDDLYAQIEYNMDTVAQSHGIVNSTKKLKINPELKNIETKYCYNLKGLEYDDSTISSRMANQIKNTFTGMIRLNGLLDFNNLMTPGANLDLKTYSELYDKYAGKYMVWSTDIILSRLEQDQWMSNCDVKIFRSVLNFKA